MTRTPWPLREVWDLNNSRLNGNEVVTCEAVTRAQKSLLRLFCLYFYFLNLYSPLFITICSHSYKHCKRKWLHQCYGCGGFRRGLQMDSSYCKLPDSSPAITILLAVLLMIPLNIQKLNNPGASMCLQHAHLRLIHKLGWKEKDLFSFPFQIVIVTVAVPTPWDWSITFIIHKQRQRTVSHASQVQELKEKRRVCS